ncbi:MAG TPA: apolipoprotein N-acyltransferase [Myxococcota bacterium]|nr:apolipoprotein N-acyltransferase [Myxococcota bacterium]
MKIEKVEMTRTARVIWSGAAALALFLAFPHPIAGRVIDLGWLLSWIAPALLVHALCGLAPRRALLWGFLTHWAAYSAILHWIYVVTVSYGHAHPVVGAIAPIALASYIALFGGLFGWSQAWLGARGLASPWSAALAWAALDHARSFALSGFPWAELGYAQHQNAALRGLASFTAVYGLSFASALGGAALLDAARAVRERARPNAGALSAIAAVIALHGLGLSATRPGDEEWERVRTAVIQGNIDQGVKWNAAWVEATLANYEAMSRDAARDGAQLIVWPETAVPGGLEFDPELRARIGALARETRAALLVGGVGLALDQRGHPAAYFDSAFPFTADGAMRARYDKSHLVPFGEYIPFQEFLGRILSAVARGIAQVGVQAGPGPRALALALPDGREVRFGTPVCYELLFPALVRGFAADGGRALLAITNDAWYGRTGAPYQFLAITELRAAETGLAIARAANTGVSASIDGTGTTAIATPIFETTYRAFDLPLHPAPAGATFYVRHGDVFVYACWALWIAHLGLAIARGRADRT